MLINNKLKRLSIVKILIQVTVNCFKLLRKVLRILSKNAFKVWIGVILSILSISVLVKMYVFNVQYTYGKSSCTLEFFDEQKQSFAINNVRSNKDKFTISKQDNWQNVSEKSDMFVYSAYLDTRGEDRVRVIGAIKQNGYPRRPVYCLLWYGDKQTTVYKVEAEVVKLNDAELETYVATFFLCYTCGLDVPDAVSIVEDHNDASPSNYVHVHDDDNKNKQKHNFTVCVSPLHHSGLSSIEMIEWLELNIIMGVNLFTFYNFSPSKHLYNVLEYYRSSGKIEMLAWTLPTIEKQGGTWTIDIHYYGQLAALNDCLYRNKARSKYIALFDLDEFIVPQSPDVLTWVEMLEQLPKASAYMFRNSFYISPRRDQQAKQSYNNNPMLPNGNYYDGILKSIEVLERDSFIYPAYYRTKYIVQTDKVKCVGIHNVWALISGSEIIVDQSQGLLHHYRTKEVFWINMVYNRQFHIYMQLFKVTKITKFVTLKYENNLRKNIYKVINSLK